MNNKRFGFVVVLAAIAIGSLDLYGQDQTLAAAAGDRYVISAKAGGVNYVEGRVSLARKKGKSGFLTKGDALEIGDTVATATGSRAEILLNPGSYLRLGDNARFEFISTSLDDLQLKLDGGSAILEVFATEDFTVSVKTPQTAYRLVRSGIYRIDVSPTGDRLEVWKGAARVSGSGDLVKSGRTATARLDAKTVIEKFDRDDKDTLDNWSKSRSRELTKIASKLDRQSTRTALMTSFLGRSWNVYNSFGLWVYNPMFGGYCFLPFGYGWNSPYGYGLGNYLGWYGLPSVVWYPPAYLPGGNNVPGSSTGRTRNGNQNQGFPGQVSRSDRSISSTPNHVPPFVRMQDAMGRGRVGFGDRDESSFDTNQSSPSYTSSAPLSVPMPVPSGGAPLSGKSPTPVRRPE